MKRKYKILLLVVALATFTLVFTGCNVVDELKNFGNQLTCEHNYDSDDVLIEEDVPATCNSTGKIVKKCGLCGKLETEVIPMTEHNVEIVPTVFPTCTEKGKTNYSRCKDCGHEISHPADIDALGHIETVVPGYPATCLTAGLSDGKVCAVCGDVLVESKVIKAYGHKVVSVGQKEPTCTEAGHTAGQKCQYCNEVYVGCEVIPALGHKGLSCPDCNYSMPLAEYVAGEHDMVSLESSDNIKVGEVYCTDGVEGWLSFSLLTATADDMGNKFTFDKDYLNAEDLLLNFTCDDVTIQGPYDEEIGELTYISAWTGTDSLDECYPYYDLTCTEPDFNNPFTGIDIVKVNDMYYVTFLSETVSINFTCGLWFNGITEITFNISDLVPVDGFRLI